MLLKMTVVVVDLCCRVMNVRTWAKSVKQHYIRVNFPPPLKLRSMAVQKWVLLLLLLLLLLL